MAPLSKCQTGFISTVLLCVLICLPYTTVELQPEDSRTEDKARMRGELVGSRPPACMNKCLSCRPCMATLVVQPPQKIGAVGTSSHGAGDNGYYHLSWKCKCGNKLFQP